MKHRRELPGQHSHSYDESWEPRIAKMILEQLKSHQASEALRVTPTTVVDDFTAIESTTTVESRSDNPASEESIHIHNDEEDDGTTSSFQRPLMVALVGIPGGGKSISSLLLANTLEEQGYSTMILPHDGYHLPMDQLRQYPEAADMIYRRGAPDTFDPAALQRDLDRIRNNSHHEEGLITLPGFEHEKGDPEPDKHIFDRNVHQVVIAEGLYLLYDRDGWEEISSYFDLKVFIDSDIDNCMDRLKVRNLAIPGYTEEEIFVRVDEVDRVNAHTVLETRGNADIIVESIVAKSKKSETIPRVPSQASGLSRHSRVPSFEALNLIVTTVQAEEEPHGIWGYEESQGLMLDMDMEEPKHAISPIIGTWEKDMAQEIKRRMEEDPTQRPFMVGLVGMPGSGKGCSVFLLANELEQMGLNSMTMPHDGYHYTIDYLKSFVHSDDVIYRRGAPDTFDPTSLYRDMDRIRNDTQGETMIKVPGFDHAKGDPEPDQHIFDRHHHDVVICEGLYLLHDDDGWSDIKSLLDFSIFMDGDVDVCVERVKIRNQCIPGYSPEEIMERAEKVDRVNATTVLRSKDRADIVVESTAVKKQ